MTMMDATAGKATHLFDTDQTARIRPTLASRMGDDIAVRQSAVFIEEDALLRQVRSTVNDARHLDLSPGARVALFRLGALDDHRIIVLARRTGCNADLATLQAREEALRELCGECGADLCTVAWIMSDTDEDVFANVVSADTAAGAMEAAAEHCGVALTRSWLVARDAGMLADALEVHVSTVALTSDRGRIGHVGSALDLGAAVRFIDDVVRLADPAEEAAVQAEYKIAA